MALRAACWSGLALFSWAALGQNGPSVEQTRLPVRFEAHSSRLAPEQADRFSQLGRIRRDLPDATLVILLPLRQEVPNARFVAARAAELQRHLQSIGLSATARRESQSAGDEDTLYIAVEAPAPVPVPAQEAEPPSATTARPPAEPSSPPIWRADAGRTLRDLLNDWAAQAGWTVVWRSSFDYPLEASASFTADFADAVGQLMRGFSEAKPAPTARLHRANQVVIIE